VSGEGGGPLLADTQILIWYVLEPGRLSSAAVDAIETEVAAGEPVRVSAWSLVEIGYATEKRSNPLTHDDRLAILAVLDEPESPFEIVPVTDDIARRVIGVSRSENADPGDRVIVATAEVLGASLVSSDRKISTMTSRAIIWK
jgi:PIN domain nuclease of toxin-antitoxin system